MMKNLEGTRLIVLDFGGVIRDSSAGLHEGYRAGFASVGLRFDYGVVDTWHLRGVGKYDIGLECIKALLSLEITGQSCRLPEILAVPQAESILDGIVGTALDDDGVVLAERIRLRYKEFFNSAAARPLVSIYPGVEAAIRALKAKGYLVALLTNGNRVTVDRDLPFAALFDKIVSEDEAAAKKPSGQGLLHIMSELSVVSAETAFVCDAPNDIHAGRDADVTCIAVLGGMGLRPHLELARPDHIADNVLEVVAQLPTRGTPGTRARTGMPGPAQRQVGGEAPRS